MKLAAQRLVLDLLTALRGEAMPVRALVAAAGVFGITENNLRVTLARLRVRGLVERNERGQYRLAESAAPVQSHVVSWRRLERRVIRWRGDWIGVHTAGLPRVVRSSRRRCRAFDFLGLRELARHLWVRPDNLAGGVADLRRRLVGLGLEAGAPVFALGQLDDAGEARARGLWDVEALRAGYRDITREIARSRDRLSALPLERAMAESFLLGGRAIHLLVFDPLLPDEIAPADERRAVIEAMRRYDALGRSVWSRFLLERGGPEIASLLPDRASGLERLEAWSTAAS